MIVHIMSEADWEKAKGKREYRAPSLGSEGFIHCSTPRQAADTANIFFKGKKGLPLLCIDERKLQAECRYEAPSGGGLHDPSAGKTFPHIYGPLNLSAVVKVVDFPPNADGSFSLPGELSGL